MWRCAFVAAVVCAGCGPGPIVATSDLPVQPDVVTAARADLLAAPTRASALEGGACVTQADCEDGEACVASDIGIAECMPADGTAVSAPRDARGRARPAPPRGLVDGQVMRDHAARSAE